MTNTNINIIFDTTKFFDEYFQSQSAQPIFCGLTFVRIDFHRPSTTRIFEHKKTRRIRRVW